METAFTTTVHAREETVWKVLRDKIEHPERYVPGILGCTVLERGEERILREVRMEGATFREEVTLDPAVGEVTFTLLDHPWFTGTALNRASSTSRQSPVAATMLTLILDWTPREGTPGLVMLAGMPTAVRKAAAAIREAAEELDAEWSEDEGEEPVPQEERGAKPGPVEEHAPRA